MSQAMPGTSADRLSQAIVVVGKGGFGDVESVANKYINDGVVANNRFIPNKMAISNEFIDLLEFEVLPGMGNNITIESGIAINFLFRNNKNNINL